MKTTTTRNDEFGSKKPTKEKLTDVEQAKLFLGSSRLPDQERFQQTFLSWEFPFAEYFQNEENKPQIV